MQSILDALIDAGLDASVPVSNLLLSNGLFLLLFSPHPRIDGDPYGRLQKREPCVSFSLWPGLICNSHVGYASLTHAVYQPHSSVAKQECAEHN